MTLLEKVLNAKPMVTFSSYYKYSFSFSGTVTLDNGQLVKINASLGGEADNIYRTEISATTQELLTKDTFNSISVENTVTGETDSWNDY